VAAGAAEQLPFAQVANLGRVMNWLKDYGVRCIGTSDRAESSLYDADLTGSVALIMGREHTGLGKSIASRCDTLVSLPMKGAVSSLNVSVATGISLYEIVRQQGAENLTDP
jgi:23S rRNA (guanosine2251-2'-O)-methyltransferase